jgi:uncharacterized membrane protein
MVISALPVVELRGGVPVGLWMGLPPLQTAVLACIGNFLPVPIILTVLNSSAWLREKVKPRLEKKLTEVTGAKLNWQSLVRTACPCHITSFCICAVSCWISREA